MTKDKIVAIATRLFAHSGYAAVSTRKICDEAGCNMAAISYYFGGKDKLYSECLNTLDQDTLNDFIEILRPPTDKDDCNYKLHRFCVSMCTFVSQNTFSLKLLINHMNKHHGMNGHETNFLRPLLQKTESFIQEGIQRKIISEDIEPKLITNFIFHSIISQMLFKTFRPYEEISNQEFAQKIIRHCTGSFYV